jgi:nucleoside-diphosphate-sugar epimerase
MKVLITGGNGYIAKSLYNALKDQYEITPITRKHFDLTDYRETRKWFKTEYDVVIHTAAVGGTRLQPDAETVLQDNLTMYSNLYANRDKFKKLISFGSGAELFNSKSYYGMSKRSIASSIQETADFYNLRIFATFDENELDTRFIKANILKYLKNQPMLIHTDKIMDFFYMKDLINLTDYYIKNTVLKKEINCCYEHKYTLSNIANIINELDTYKVPIQIENKNTLEFYCGVHSEFPIKTIGLTDGIKYTFKSLYENSINNRG